MDVFIKNTRYKWFSDCCCSNTKISEVENKIPDHAKYITTQKFKKLTRENFAARLTQANLVSKTDFDNDLISFKRKISSNKTKYLEVLKKLDNQTTNDYIFLGKMYFISNDGSQNSFVHQPTLDILEVKKTKVLIIFLVVNLRECIILNLSHYMLLSYIAKTFWI